MSIQSEIDRIAGAKPILGNYLQQNGVAVPSGATLDEMALQLADVIEKQNKITVSGILRGDGAGGVSAAVAGTDYATPDDAKAFVVTFTENTGDLQGTYTPDKTLAEIYAAYNANKNIIGRFASGDPSVMMLMTVYGASDMEMGFIHSGGVVKLNPDSNNIWFMNDYPFERPAYLNAFLPESGYPLSSNFIYNPSSPVDTYVFTPPESGWAHGTFTTGSSVSVSFSGTFVGAAPTIEASKTYEFDVLDGVWAVQEVVSA